MATRQLLLVCMLVTLAHAVNMSATSLAVIEALAMDVPPPLDCGTSAWPWGSSCHATCDAYGDLNQLVVCPSAMAHGSLSPAIGNLAATLTKLSIWGNAVSGTIPSEVSSLSQLTHLEIRHLSLLHGTVPSLPDALVTVFLHRNRLHGPITVLPPSLNSCKLFDAPLSSETNCFVCDSTSVVDSACANYHTACSGSPPCTATRACALSTVDSASCTYPLVNLSDDSLALIDALDFDAPRDWMCPLLAEPPNQQASYICDEFGGVTRVLAQFPSQQSDAVGASLPSEMTRLSSLTCLQVGSSGSHTKAYATMLTGTLPRDLANLTNLQILTIQNSRLSGPLPPLLPPALMQFQVTNNRLTGDIPSAWGGGPATCELVRDSADSNCFSCASLPSSCTTFSSSICFDNARCSATAGCAAYSAVFPDCGPQTPMPTPEPTTPNPTTQPTSLPTSEPSLEPTQASLEPTPSPPVPPLPGACGNVSFAMSLCPSPAVCVSDGASCASLVSDAYARFVIDVAALGAGAVFANDTFDWPSFRDTLCFASGIDCRRWQLAPQAQRKRSAPTQVFFDIVGTNVEPSCDLVERVVNASADAAYVVDSCGVTPAPTTAGLNEGRHSQGDSAMPIDPIVGGVVASVVVLVIVVLLVLVVLRTTRTGNNVGGNRVADVKLQELGVTKSVRTYDETGTTKSVRTYDETGAAPAATKSVRMYDAIKDTADEAHGGAVPVMSTAAFSELESRFVIDGADLVKSKKIGEGSFGYVFVGEWRGTPVAIKEAKASPPAAVAALVAEIEASVKLRPHTNVVALLGVLREPLSMIVDLCARGSLDDALYGEKVVEFDDARTRKIVLGVGRGVAHLHAEGVIHRDLAARNILLDESWTPKIADLGMARSMIAADEVQQTMATVGPVRWMAPEQLLHQEYSRASDAWAFGVILFEIYAREVPFKGMTNVRVIQSVTSGSQLTPPDTMPTEVAEQCDLLWRRDPASRPVVSKVVASLRAKWSVQDK